MSGGDDDAREAREEADWRSIVENYGETPSFPDTPRPLPELFEPLPQEVPPELDPVAAAEEADRYVPPPPPPVPRPRGLRLLAWMGLFGVPAVVLVLLVIGISLPPLVGVLLLVWFIGGFAYLVATMHGPHDPDGGWDDGAVV